MPSKLSPSLGRPSLPTKFQIPHTSAKIAAAKAPVPAIAVKAKAEMAKRLPELESTVESLVVTTPAEYQEADAILRMIQDARDDWKARFYGGVRGGKTYEPIVPPMRAALDALYALVREVDQPLETMEKAVKQLQSAYKLEELRVAREVEAEKARKLQAIAHKKQALEEKAARAKPAVAAAMAVQMEVLDEQAQEVESESVEFVQAESSTARFARVWTHADMKATLKAVLAGAIPIDAICVNEKRVNEYYKEDPQTVESWPGFGGKDDVTIAGRRGR